MSCWYLSIVSWLLSLTLHNCLPLLTKSASYVLLYLCVERSSVRDAGEKRAVDRAVSTS